MIKLLLVEDDPMVAELNRAYVERVGGFEIVASVRSRQEALDVLRQRSVDLILLDIFMVGQTGMDLLAEIRQMSLDVDVIFVTAARDTKTIARALKLGAVDYLIKPFEFERLKQALESYRGSHGLMKEAQAVSQSELDKVIIRQPADSRSRDQLPKGLDRVTLERVCGEILGRPADQRGFTSEELAGAVGLSRVSVRKYVEFLCSIRVLRMEPVYGATGRPVHRFTVQDAYREEFRRFL